MDIALVESRFYLFEQLSPIWQVSETKRGFRGPASQINRKRHALPGVCAEDNYTIALAVMPKHGTPILRDQNRPAPPVRESHGFESRIQPAHASLESRDELGRVARIDIDVLEFAPILYVDETASENDPARRQQPSPEIGKIDGIKRLPRA